MSKPMEFGTHGRNWYTDEKDNIAFSFFIKANCSIQQIDGITLEIAATLVEVFKKLYDIELAIKSPNDIVINDKKIGGILTETKVKGKMVRDIIIGIGVNTNKEKFPIEISKIATSIKKEFNIEIDNEKVIGGFCELFENKLIERNLIK